MEVAWSIFWFGIMRGIFCVCVCVFFKKCFPPPPSQPFNKKKRCPPLVSKARFPAFRKLSL